MPHYYTPSTKAELIKIIKPKWKGKMLTLRRMSKPQLYVIFHRIRREWNDNTNSNM